MASNSNNEVNITFKAFNQSFNSAIREMDTEAKNLRQEMKLQQEQMKHTGTSTEKLEAKMSSLQQIYDVQRRKTQEASQALERAKQLWGENSEEVRKLEAQLKRHQIAEQQAANAVTETQQALERAQQAQDNQQKSLKQLNNILQVTGNSLGDFSDLLGQNLTQAIKNGTASTGQLEGAFRQIAGATQSAGVDIDQVRQTIAQLNNGANIDTVRNSLIALSTTTATAEDEVKRLQQALKLQQEEMKHSATESQRLQANVTGLQGIYEALRRATNETEQALTQARATYGANSAEAKRLEAQLTRNQIAQQQMANSVKETQNAMEQHGNSLRQLDRLFDTTQTSVNDFANVLGNDLTNAIRNGTATSAQLEQAIDQIGRSSLGANVDLERMREALRRLGDGANIDEIRHDLDQLGNEAEEAETSVKELGSQLAGLATVAGGAGGALKLAFDSSKLDTKINVGFEVTEESKTAIREVTKSVQAMGVDNEESLEGIRRQWALNAKASDETNARIVKGAAAVSYAYEGIDFVELVQEVNEIGKELKITDDEALNLVDSLLKTGFPPEQLDIIAEYGNQLQRAGYSAREVQGLFAAGVATGTWNIDNLLDGLKEGRILAAEMGAGLTTAMKTSLKIATDDGKKMSEEQLNDMKSSMSKQESALSSSLDKRLKATTENNDKQKEHFSKTLEKEYEAASRTYEKQEAALEKSLSKKQDALSASLDKQKEQLDKALSKEYESVASSYDKQESDLEKSLSKKEDAVKDSYEKQKDELEKALEKEYSAFEKSTEKKIALIDKEYTEKLKLIDEEKYNQIKAIDSQINRLDSLTEAEDKAAKARENANRRAELVASISFAKTAKERQTASKNLAEFDEKMRLESKKEARKGIIDSLKDKKEEINDEFSSKKDALKSEQEEVKAKAKETADEAKKAIKEEQEASKKALDDKAKDSLKSLSEANKSELEAFLKLNKEKLSVLKEEQAARKKALDTQAKNELSALNERAKAELSTFRDVNKQKLDNLKEEQTARKSALDKRLSNEIEAVRSANQSELESFREMNQKKLEMAKNPPDSAQFKAMEQQIIDWGKAVAKGGEEGTQAFEEMIVWLDSIEDATVRNAIGVGLFGTKWEDQGENITDTLLGLDAELKKIDESQNKVNDTADDFDADAAISVGEALGKLTEALRPLLDIISKVIVGFANFAKEHPELVAVIGTVLAVLGMLAGAFMALAPIIYSISSIFPALKLAFAAIMPFITGLIGSLPTLGAVFAALTGPIGIAIAAVAAIIAIAVLLVKNWDSVSEFFVKLWNGIVDVFKSAGSAIIDFLKKNWQTILMVITGPLGILVKTIVQNWGTIKNKTVEIFSNITNFLSNILSKILGVVRTAVGKIKGFFSFSDLLSNVKGKWNSVYTAIKTPIDKARDAVKSAIDRIKGFFNFKFKWPELKMPKFKIKKGSLNPMKWFSEGFPEIDIEWFAKGGIMTGPTVFGGSGNTAFVGGEAGNEAILPLNERVLGAIGNAIYAASGREVGGQQVVNNFEKMLDGAVFHVREEADIKKIARELGDYTKVRQRGGRK